MAKRTKTKTVEFDLKNNETPFLSGAKTERVPSTYRDELGRFTEGNEGLSKRYTDKQSLMSDVISYLDKCSDGKKTPTVTGLALSLGFRSRRSILNYEREAGYEMFYEVISYAKMKIEEYLEERLLDSRNTNIAGLIFNLKNNFDWQDKQDIRMDQRTMQLVGFNFVHPHESEIQNTEYNGKETN
jgi:hypothetical protein